MIICGCFVLKNAVLFFIKKNPFKKYLIHNVKGQVEKYYVRDTIVSLTNEHTGTVNASLPSTGFAQVTYQVTSTASWARSYSRVSIPPPRKGQVGQPPPPGHRIPTFYPWNSLIFPWSPKIFPSFFLSFWGTRQEWHLVVEPETDAFTVSKQSVSIQLECFLVVQFRQSGAFHY